MSMIAAYRIFKTNYAENWFDGEGSRLYGGRWNSPGHRLLYASSSVALALLEIVVHLQSDAPIAAYSWAEIRFDEKQVLDVFEFAPEVSRLTNRSSVADHREIGDRWVSELSSLILKVPSVIVSAESNYLINLKHPDAESLQLGTPAGFVFDERLSR